MMWKFLERLRKRSEEIGYTCDGCGAEVFTYPAQRLCAACLSSLNRNEQHRCIKCGRQTVTEGVCLVCKSQAPAFLYGVSPFVYRSYTAGLINRMKNGNRRLACFFGEEMADFLMAEWAKKNTNEVGRYAMNEKESQKSLLVVYVPATEKSLKARGYNQARDLAERVVKRLRERGVSVEFGDDVLQKRKETEPQKHMHFQERAENIAGAYHVHRRLACKDRTIVLVDDIMTTGATGDEIAKRLYGAGAKEVVFLVAAAMAEQK